MGDKGHSDQGAVIGRRVDSNAELLYRLEHDGAHHLVRATITGCWVGKDLERYADDLRPMMAICRSRYGMAKLLVDRLGAPVQSQAVHNRLIQLMPTYLRDTDALAMVVSSALVRMQAKRVLILSRSDIFLDEGEALAWLATF